MGYRGVQVGAKVPVNDAGEVGDVFCVARYVKPGSGCLWCNGLINAAKLQDEAVSDETRRGYAYVADPSVTAPSVVTSNAIACAHAADDYLFYVTGLKFEDAESHWFRWNSRKGTAGVMMVRGEMNCV